MGTKMKSLGIILALLFIVSFIGSSAFAQEVKLGALQDTTGATSDVGKDEAMGVREAVQYYNDAGRNQREKDSFVPI